MASMSYAYDFLFFDKSKKARAGTQRTKVQDKRPDAKPQKPKTEKYNDVSVKHQYTG